MADMYEKRSGRATRQKYQRGRRDKVVQVRMNDEELSLLDELRGTCSRSNFLRCALYPSRRDVRRQTVVVDVPELDRVRMELNRIGVNVNQIARARNEYIDRLDMLEAARYRVSTQDEAEELRGFREAVDRLREEVEGLRDDLQRRDDDPWGGA